MVQVMKEDGPTKGAEGQDSILRIGGGAFIKNGVSRIVRGAGGR